MSHYTFVVPYRNLPNCLTTFVDRFPAYIATQEYISSFTILIVEQEQGKLFNLAKLVNVGFDYYKNNFPYDKNNRLIFHPIDGIPLSGSYEVPDDSCVMFCEPDPIKLQHGDNIAGKAHGFQNHILETINGYSNEYWGWGCEDDDMLIRLRVNNIPIFGTYIQYQFLMEHRGEQGGRPNLDKPIHDISNWSHNDQVYLTMQQTGDFLSSGLNTLTYTVLEKNTIDFQQSIFHIKVSI